MERLKPPPSEPTKSRLTRRQFLKLAAQAGVTALTGDLLTSCAKAPSIPAPEATPEPSASERLAQANLDDFIPTYNKLVDFKNRFGVTPPPFSAITETIRAVADGSTSPLDALSVYRLGNSWGTRTQEVSSIDIHMNLDTLPVENRLKAAHYLSVAYSAMLGMKAVSAGSITIEPDSVQKCGVDTGGCTDTITHITMDDYTASPEAFYTVLFHEIGHDLEARLPDKLEYFFKDQFIAHYSDYADFYTNLASYMDAESPDELRDYGISGRKTQEVVPGTTFDGGGDVLKTYVECFKEMNPVMSWDDLPSNFSEITDAFELFNQVRLPLFKRALTALKNDEVFGTTTARNNKAITDYVDANLRYFRHVLLDSDFTEGYVANSLGQFMQVWQRRLQGSRFNLLSQGAVPADTPIAGLRQIFQMD